MKSKLFVICISLLCICFQSCSIQGKYFMVKTTHPDFHNSVKIDICTRYSGNMNISDSLSGSFFYKQVLKNRYGRILEFEFVDTNQLMIKPNLVFLKNRLILGDINDNSYYFVKIPPLSQDSPAIPTRYRMK